jgi:hypothetical protein
MEQVIWIELVTRNHQVVARFRFEKKSIRIGRGYDNDVVIDDPYIAASHIVIEADENGRLSARDLNTLNGFTIGKNKKRQNAAQLNDDTLIGLGQTFLRTRTGASPVPAEKQFASQKAWWVELILLLALPSLFTCLLNWMESTERIKLSTSLMSIAGMTIFMLGWGGIWSIFSRIFAGAANFGRHVRIACLILIGMLLLYVADTVGSYAFATPLISRFMYMPIILLIGYFVFESLCLVSNSRVLWKAVIVGGLAALLIGIFSLTLFSEPKIVTTHDFNYYLAPSNLRLVPEESRAEFLAKAGAMKTRLDAARKEEPPADYSWP